jgi:hypothetical protein
MLSHLQLALLKLLMTTLSRFPVAFALSLNVVALAAA